MLLLWTLLLTLSPTLIPAFPDGAPGYACKDMMPSHSMASAQPGQGLYSIMTEKTNEGVIGLLVNSGAEKFEGWMIQAREVGSEYIIGSFVPSATPDGAAKGIMCVKTPNDTLTHAGAACVGSSEEMSGELSNEGGEEEAATSNTSSAAATSEEAATSVELRELEFLWVPPEDYSGDVRFVATVVEGFTTFYVGIESDVIFYL